MLNMYVPFTFSSIYSKPGEVLFKYTLMQLGTQHNPHLSDAPTCGHGGCPHSDCSAGVWPDLGASGRVLWTETYLSAFALDKQTTYQTFARSA